MALILCLSLSGQNRDLGLLLALAASCMVVLGAIQQLSPVILFFRQLEEAGNLDPQLIGILLKAVGVGLIGELAAMICTDGGNAAMGKALRLLASGTILVLSLPLFQQLLDLVGDILVMA